MPEVYAVGMPRHKRILRLYFPRPGSRGPATVASAITGTVGMIGRDAWLCRSTVAVMHPWGWELVCRLSLRRRPGKVSDWGPVLSTGLSSREAAARATMGLPAGARFDRGFFTPRPLQ